MRNKFPITVDLEGEVFSVNVVANLSTENVKEMDRYHAEVAGNFKKRDELANELNEKQEEYEINKELIKTASLVQKGPLLLEQKSLNKRIHVLKKDLKVFDEENDSLQEVLKKLKRKRYSLMVTGTDAERLRVAVDESGLDYDTLFTFFAKEISAAKEGN